jgi:perosamine synthetase
MQLLPRVVQAHCTWVWLPLALVRGMRSSWQTSIGLHRPHPLPISGPNLSLSISSPIPGVLDPEKAEAAITPKTKAIIAVHLYGNLCEMDALLDIGHRYGIPIIEDPAEAIGSVYHGKRAGSMGIFGTFSFHGTKTITTGEGGMFVTNDDALYEKVLTLSNHGRARGQTKQFWPDMIGFKYKMSNIQAAIGCAQMERIEELIAGKRRIFAYYAEHFRNLPLKMNPEPAGTTNGYWMSTIVVDEGVPFNREDLLAAFKA